MSNTPPQPIPSRGEINVDLEQVVTQTLASGRATLTSHDGHRVERILQIARAYVDRRLIPPTEDRITQSDNRRTVYEAEAAARRPLIAKIDRLRRKRKRLKGRLERQAERNVRLLSASAQMQGERDKARESLVEAMRIEEARRQTLLQIKRVHDDTMEHPEAKLAKIRRLLAAQDLQQPASRPIRRVNASDVKPGDETIETVQGAEPRLVSCVHELDGKTQICWSEGAPAYRNYPRGEQVDVLGAEESVMVASGGWCAPPDQLYSLYPLYPEAQARRGLYDRANGPSLSNEIVLRGHTLKMFREALCGAQTSLLYHPSASQAGTWRRVLGAIIDSIDEGLSPDGEYQYEWTGAPQSSVSKRGMTDPVKITVKAATYRTTDKSTTATLAIERDGKSFEVTVPLAVPVTSYHVGA